MVLLPVLKACKKTAFFPFPSHFSNFVQEFVENVRINDLKSRLIGAEHSLYTISHLLSILKGGCPFRCVVGAVLFYIRFTMTSAIFYVQWFHSFYKSNAHIAKVHSLSFAIFNYFGPYLERRWSSAEPNKTLLNLTFLNPDYTKSVMKDTVNWDVV